MGKGNNNNNNKEPPKPEREWTAEMQADYDRLLTVGEECNTAADLKKLIVAKGRGSENAKGFNLYDGFEPSGRMHIAQGVFKAMNVNKCTMEGTNATFIFWVADWFALMNDKMGGDLAKIQTVGKYLIEVWKAAGMDLTHVVFKWASEEITQHADVYWPTMLDVARRFTISRIKKCCQIMGRLEGNLTAAQILYPLMQCTDVFFLKADICQLGVDQRKVNMLAKDYCIPAKIKNKPIILSHHMLYGLKAGQAKMSKSDPDSAIFMEDTKEDVERKIMNAYCPTEAPKTDDAAVEETTTTATDDAGKESMRLVEDTLMNPCLDYIQYIIFSPPNATFCAGGNTYTDFDTVKTKFLAGDITEEQLKKGLIDALNELLEPVRTHFTTDETAKDLLAKVQQYKKEASTVSDEEKVPRRLNLPDLGRVPASSHLVFAPLPHPSPTLQEAIDCLALLKQNTTTTSKNILFYSDWSARVCNGCDADPKGIAAYYQTLTTSLKALDPTLMNNVQIVFQSDAILADPSNYWISVINVGRHFQLSQVMGEDMQDSDGAGIVISRLMQVADVAGVAPASWAVLNTSDDPVTTMVESFFPAKLPTVTLPTMQKVTSPTLLLQQRELVAHKTENDEYFLLDDPKVHGKSKMKKAFCEPKNISFCPPIALATCFALDGYLATNNTNTLTIRRSEENGGDVTFSSRGELEAQFADESLHPGDLKAAVQTLMVQVLETLASAIKADPEATKASKTLKALAKKLAKNK